MITDEKKLYLDALLRAQESGQRCNKEIGEVLSEWREEISFPEESDEDKAVRLAKEYRGLVVSSLSEDALIGELSNRMFFEELGYEGILEIERFKTFVRKRYGVRR